jgi:peptidoglycan/LPS O-acetylase OafA/YrhL
MTHETPIFLLTACLCYLLAFLTSHAFISWILPEPFRRALGHEGRFVAIDGIRGYLAFGVYVHHCLVTWIYLVQGRWIPLSRNFENQLGKTSVAIFFMITAFLFWGRAVARSSVDSKSFFISRIFRIYPLYLFVLLLICLAVGFKSGWVALESHTRIAGEIGKWLILRTPIINRYADTKIVVAGVTWTLLYEAWFYLSLPLLAAVVLQKISLWKKILALAVIAALFWINHLEFPIAATFLGGFIAVYWRISPKRIQLAKQKSAALLAIACLLVVVTFLYDPFNPLGLLLLAIFFAVIASGNTLFGVLKMPAALWLGEISYSIYLCHGVILWIIMQNILPMFPGFHPTNTMFVLCSIAITPLVILFSSASYLLLEKPLIDIGHAISKRPTTSQVVQPL